MIQKNIKISLLVIVAVLLTQCGHGGKFDLAKGKVGVLDTSTTIQELQTIFKNDSLVVRLSEGAMGSNYFQDDDEYHVYEKGGAPLLVIVPKEPLDSTSTIKSIEILDPRFSTKSGLTRQSDFQEINAKNKINKVETSFLSATLFIDELNITVAIDKEELGLKSFSTQKVSLTQIPDLAKIKSLIVWFN